MQCLPVNLAVGGPPGRRYRTAWRGQLRSVACLLHRWISMKLGVGRRWIKRRCQLTIADGVDVRRAHLYHNVPGAAQEGGVFLPPWSAGDEGHQHIVPAIGAIDKDLVASIKAGAPAFREVRHYAENQPLRARDTWRSCRYCMGASSELARHFGSSNPENRSLH
jgi:hypothetical protein